MFVTHSFIGTPIGEQRLLFFLLYEDYNDRQRAYVREFEIYLERFARDLRHSAAVVSPFTADIERTRTHVLKKGWTQDELRELRELPGLLVIDRDFDEFSPREHSWLLLKFGEEAYGSPEGHSKMGELFRDIAESVQHDPVDDIYRLMRDLTAPGPRLGEVFEVKPSVFGMSIDVKRAGFGLRRLLRERNSWRAPGRQR